MTKPQPMVRKDFGRGEAIGGIVWLCLGAVVSLIIEVVYLGAAVTLSSGRAVAVPVTILVAWWFNRVLARTARLWNPHPLVVCAPLAVWVLGFFFLMFGVQITGDQMLSNNIRTVGLLFAGVYGGVWPLVHRK